MRNSKKLKETTNSRIYHLLDLNYKRGCPICGPHSGCNSIAKKEDRSWKNFRKTQYKIR